MDTVTGPARLAARIVAQYARTKAAKPRSHDARTEAGRLRGLFDALDALDLAMTPDHAHLNLLDAVREVEAERRERPQFNPTNNQAMRDWDSAVAAAFVRLMGW